MRSGTNYTEKTSRAMYNLNENPDQLRRIELFTKQTKFTWLLLALIAALVISCTPKSTPPGASTIYGGVGNTSYSYNYWQEGLAILFWHDFVQGAEGCSGSGSTEDPVYRLECDVESGDGHAFSWQVHTTDGVTADMWIDDQIVDLAQGNMFLVHMGESSPEIQQLQRDFSALEPTNEAVAALATTDPDIANFVAKR